MVPPERLDIQLDRGSDTPLYRQIERAIRDRILAGAIEPETRLPPERTLAEALGVDRTTVIAAYRELANAGLVAPHVGRGTIVQAVTGTYRGAPFDGGASRPDGAGEPPLPIRWEEHLLPRTDEDPIIEEIAELSARPGVISLASGIPAPGTYPIAEFRALLDEALGRDGEGLLQYCPPEGLPSLRESLAQRMREQGTRVTSENILICAGSQQGLYLLARSLIDPGDVVAVEAPTYLGALQVFRAAGARLITLPSDRDGLVPERLEELLARRSVKLIYVLPTFQNPTGNSLSLRRREQLVAIATRHGVPIIEDDPYSALRYEGEALPTLAQLSGPHGPVIYLSTFSKVLFPGFRLGWVAAAPQVLERLTWEKTLVDLDSNPLAQWAMSAYIERGLLDDHLSAVRRVYPEQRDALVSGLSERAALDATWRVPKGGFYLWVQLGGALRARDVLDVSQRAEIVFMPGDVFHVDGGGRSAMRLSFSGYPPDRLFEAGRVIGRAIQAVKASHSSRSPASPPTRIV